MGNQIKGPLSLEEYVSYRDDGLIPHNEIDYQVEYSLVCNGSNVRAMYTPTVASDDDHKWFYSGFVEITKLNTARILYASWDSINGGIETIRLQPDNTLSVQLAERGTALNWDYYTSRRFISPGFYHIHVAVDTTNPVAEERIQLFVNLERTYFTTAVAIPQNAIVMTGGLFAHSVYGSTTNDQWFDGYVSDTIVGIGVLPNGVTDFAIFDFNDIKPIEYKGPIGTTGSYLKFHDHTNLGKAYRGNDWVVVGAPERSRNTPTRTLVKWNINCIDPDSQSSENARKVTHSNPATLGLSVGTIGAPPRTKTYWEYQATNPNITYPAQGVADITQVTSPMAGSGAGTVYGATRSWKYCPDGTVQTGATYGSTGYWPTYIALDRIGVALDRINNLLTFFKNGKPVGTLQIPDDETVYTPAVFYSQPADASRIFAGRDEWAFGPPSDDYEELSSVTRSVDLRKLDSLSKHFAQGVIVTDSTNSTIPFLDEDGNAISFEGDDYLLLGKNLDVAYDFNAYDTTRGPSSRLFTNTPGGAVTDTSTITALNESGFGVGTHPQFNGSNGKVWWAALRAGTQIANTQGTIPSLVSINQEFGFGIIRYTGNGINPATVGHGCKFEIGKTITKRVSTEGSSDHWGITHSAMGDALGILFTAAAASSATAFNNNIGPNGSVIPLANNSINNAAGVEYVVYVFAKDSPFIKCFGYKGTGSTNGPNIHVDMIPALWWNKVYSTTQSWCVWSRVISDNKENPVKRVIYYDLSAVSDLAVGERYAGGSSIKEVSTHPAQNTNGADYLGVVIGQPTVLKRAN